MQLQGYSEIYVFLWCGIFVQWTIVVQGICAYNRAAG